MLRYEILDVPINDISPDELRDLLRQWVATGQGKMVVTPNPEIILESRHDATFRNILKEADAALPDGVGLRFALAALTDQRLHYRHTGTDTLVTLAELCRDTGKRLVLLGGTPKKTQQAAMILTNKFPGLDVQTFDPGIVDSIDPRLSEATLAGLERLAPQVVGVALGHGKQEKIMHILKQKLPSINLLLGMGGASDYVSLAVKRAPTTWQRWGFEWLWRLMQEPWRYKRIFKAVIIFPLVVAWTALRQKHLWRSLQNVYQEICQHWRENKNSNNHR